MLTLIEVRVPKMGLDTTEVALAKWLVRTGDRVKKGVPLLEIESEKAALQVESEVDGTIAKICQPEGSTVPVGEVVCLVRETQSDEGKNE